MPSQSPDISIDDIPLDVNVIESKTKRYIIHPNFRDHTGVLKSHPDAMNNLKLIRNAIRNGIVLPDFCYRTTSGKDYLLEELNVLHLHLYKGSSELLYLIQYDDKVLILEINNHKYVDLSRNVKVLNEKWSALAALYQEIADIY